MQKQLKKKYAKRVKSEQCGDELQKLKAIALELKNMQLQILKEINRNELSSKISLKV